MPLIIKDFNKTHFNDHHLKHLTWQNGRVDIKKCKIFSANVLPYLPLKNWSLLLHVAAALHL